MLNDIQILFYLLMIPLGLILTVVWIIVPFAIIGTKPLLRRLLMETQHANALLSRIADQTKPLSSPLPPQPPQPRHGLSAMDDRTAFKDR